MSHHDVQEERIEWPERLTGAAKAGPVLVLSGGGALGALQAGFLHALVRTDFKPSLIIGTSAGAINGAFLAFNPDEDGVEKLIDIWRSLRDRSLFLFNPLRIAYQVMSKRLCLLNTDLLELLIKDHTLQDDFSATKIPLCITTTNLTAGRKEVIHKGPISSALLASTALPGIFCPVEIDGDLHVDGGVLANLDLETAIDLGASEILAIDLSRCVDGHRPDSVAGVWMQTLDVIQRDRVDREMDRLEDKAHITLIQPVVESSVSLTNFLAVDRLLEQGEQLGEDVIRQYRDANGRFQSGTIHSPLHIHK